MYLTPTMATLNQAIRLYLVERGSTDKKVDVDLAALELHARFPKLDLEELANRIWAVGVDLGFGVLQHSRPRSNR